MSALNHSQKRLIKGDNAVEIQRQKPETFAENSAWALYGENRLEEFDFEQNDLEIRKKLEKISDLVDNESVGTRETVVAILESGKSKEEIVDLLVRHFDSTSVELASQTKTEFEAAAKVDPGPLPQNPIRYLDRKSHPDYAHMNPVEFLEALWASKWKVDGVWTITQRQVNLFDDALISNLRSHCRRNGLDAIAFLPPADVKRRPLSVPVDFVEGTPEHKLAVINEQARIRMRRARERAVALG